VQAFAKQFNTTPEALDMHVIYDVSHNIAKVPWAPRLTMLEREEGGGIRCGGCGGG
jgi:hypothetical protein